MSPTTTKPSFLHYKWELILWLWLAFFFNQADRQVFSTVLPLLREDLHLTNVQAGWIATLFTAALAVTVPLAGYVGDVCNRARVVSISLFAWSVATLVSGFGSTFVFFVVVRSLATGAGEAFYAPAANALIAEHHHETRARALSIHQTSLYAGVIVSGLLSGWIAEHYGWRSGFWVFGGFGILLAGLTAFRLKSARQPNPQSTPVRPHFREVRQVLRRPTVSALILAWACMVFANIGYLTWMPTYLHEQFALSITSAGFSSMLYHHAGAFAGVMLGGYFSDRFARTKPERRIQLQGSALILGAPFIWMLGLESSLSMVYLALAIFGFFRGIYDAGIYASLFEVIEPRLRSSTLGWIIALVYLFGAISPVLLGSLKDDMGLGGTFILLATGYLLGGLGLLLAAKKWFYRDRQLVHTVETL